jgi:hypothetical protein
VLCGATVLLKDERPNVLIEVEQAHHSGTRMDEVFDLMSRTGYEGSLLNRGVWHRLADIDREEARRLGEKHKTMGMLRTAVAREGYVHNCLFVPGERAGS